MSEQPNKHVFIPPEPTESERLAWHVANSTTQHAKHLQEALTAAEQRVAFLTEQCRDLSKVNAEFSEGNQRLLQRVAELEQLVMELECELSHVLCYGPLPESYCERIKKVLGDE